MAQIQIYDEGSKIKLPDFVIKNLSMTMRYFLMIFLAIMAIEVRSEETFAEIDLLRGGAKLPVYVMSNPSAVATLILLPGGDASIGEIKQGKPASLGFLSRSRDWFYEDNFNIMIVYRASDLNALDYKYRVSEHIKEIAKAIDFAKQKFGKPVWLVGTSRGSVSGTAAAIALGEGLVQGLVLTSSVTSKKWGAIKTQNISSLKMPVLVVHHKNDACDICSPKEASEITDRLSLSPVKKFILIEGGSNPKGDPCAGLHWHGFINYEKATVKIITNWIKNPHI